MFKKMVAKILKFIKLATASNLKIESIEEDKKSGLIHLVVRIDGKFMPPIKKEPFELLKQASAKRIFSDNDFNLIIHYMLENQKRLIEKKHQKVYSLIKHQFSDQQEEPLIVFKDITTDQIYIKAAKDVFADINVIRKFNSEDSVCIGNIVGHFEAEKEFKLRQAQIANISNVIKFDISLLSG